MKEYLPLPHPVRPMKRGAGLRALALLTCAWVGVRAAFGIGDGVPLIAPALPYSSDVPPSSGKAATFNRGEVTDGPIAQMAAPPLLWAAPFVAPERSESGAALLNRHRLQGSLPTLRRSTIVPPLARMSQIMAPAKPHWVPPPSVPTATNPPFWTASALEPKAAPANPNSGVKSIIANSGDGPLSLYAYLFYRPDAAPGASATTYGGSQLFLRVDWRLGDKGLVRRSSLYARASRDMTRDGQAELAIGGAVQPFAAVPITLHGERRVRQRGPDATAAFISGGVSDVILPHGVVLNAYGQGGAVWPDKGESSAFFDGQASLTKPVYTAGSWRLDAGGMAATGGQDGIARLDIGPVVAASTGTGGAQLQGQVGWRFRIAGDAAPANGPAVTLSVGF